MQVQQLGNKAGKMLVFGGVYSNLQALEALKARAEADQIAPQQIICTGDVVAYCAQPEECVQLVRDWGIHVIAGNVELQLANGEEDCACDFVQGGRCDTFSKSWYPYAQQQLSETSLKWMGQLPEFLQFNYAGKRIFALHGSYHHTSEFIFASTDWATKQLNFDDTHSDVILAGHCGLPFAQSQEDNHWLNAGVIGMPANDGTSKVWYMTLEDTSGIFGHQYHRLDYNFKLAKQLMEENGLPQAYAKTLATGIWDNMEILPPVEEALVGQELVF